MQLVPNSAGSVDLFEFNPCHEPAGSSAGGQFTVKGQGRCLGDAARRAARRVDSQLDAAIADARAEASQTQQARLYALSFGDVDPAEYLDWTRRGKLRHEYYRRKALKDIASARQESRGIPVPAFMKQDVKRAWQTDRVNVIYDPKVDSAGDLPGLAAQPTRSAWVQPSGPTKRYHTKSEQLSVLRHELGHLDRTELGRGGHIVRGERYSARYHEEIRAWKNAIRNSGGKVDFNTVRAGLRSYLADEPNAVGKFRGADKIADQHVALLKRYAKRIRRASKGVT